MDAWRLRGALGAAVAGRTVLEAHTEDDGGVTCFPASSISKVLLATCVASLAERGALAYDDELGRRWPAAPAPWARLELWHLLTHAAGLPHWGALEGVEMRVDPPRRDELVALASEVPLLGWPGARWSYSGVGYLALASVVEEVAGASYHDVVRATILEPLGMDASTSGSVPDARTAAGSWAGEPVDCPPALSALPGTGDLWSTAGDLTRFAQALLSGALVGEAAVDAMLSPRVGIPAAHSAGATLRATAQGLGPRVGVLEGRTVWFHPGDNPGYVSMLALVPELGASVVILASDEAADLEPVLHVALEEACATA